VCPQINLAMRWGEIIRVAPKGSYEGVLHSRVPEWGRVGTRVLFTIQNNEPVKDARSQMSVDFNTNQNYIFARAASMELTSCDFFWEIEGDLTDLALALLADDLPATFLTLFFRASAFLAAFFVMAACVDGPKEVQVNLIWGESWTPRLDCTGVGAAHRSTTFNPTASP
jgi:hypothetical protein